MKPLRPARLLRKTALRVAQPYLDDWARRELRLVPIAETAPEDVFIIGFPKSGHTWFQNLGAGLLYGLNPEHAPDTLIQALVPDLAHVRYFQRFSTPMLFKSHDLPQPQFRRVVYLVRDGRDTLVSLRHFAKNLGQAESDPVAAARHSETLFPVRWHDHVEQWLANPHDAQMLIVKYEDLLRDTVAQLARFAKFLGLTRERAELERVCRGAAFDRMQHKERTTGWSRQDWPKDKPFVRRGVAGSHKDELPPAAVHAFEETAGPTLRKLGYL